MYETEGEQLLANIATGISKEDPVIQALIYDSQKNHGAIADAFEEVKAFVDYYTHTPSVQDHTTDSLDTIVRLFTGLERRGTTWSKERDPSYLRRMQACTVRNNDKVWGTKWNITHALTHYFPNSHCFVIENTDSIANNLVIAGDFEKEDEYGTYLPEVEAWTLTGGASMSRAIDTTFSGRWGLVVPVGTSACASQTIHLEPGMYTLHAFINGCCGVSIRDSAGNYYHAPDFNWQETPYVPIVESGAGEAGTAWKPIQYFIRVVQPDAITIGFHAVDREREAAVDYVRLFHKLKNPSYTIIVYYAGYDIDISYAHLSVGTEDPTEQIPDYRKESYYEGSFIVGMAGPGHVYRYGMLFDRFKPVGVECFVEKVEHLLYRS
ncbi:hypothetical protein PilKf_01841 [Pillotina sp. SPG140]|jgi:hypothetical protein